MPLFKSDDLANNAPKGKSVIAGTSARGNVVFANTTNGAFVNNTVKGLYGISVTEAGVAPGKVTHAGWNLVTQGTGPVAGLTIVAGGTGYKNTDVITVSGGVTNASATMGTNSTGGITSVVLVSGGTGFINTSATTLAIANSTGGSTSGSTANVTFTLGGRANRVQYETLVAMGSAMSSNGSGAIPGIN
jgi:hypothetical protein